MVRIRSFFFTKGVSFPKTIWSQKGILHIKDVIKGKADEFAVMQLLDFLEYIKQKIKTISLEIQRIVEQRQLDKEQDVIESVPGIGRATSEAILAEIIDPSRFKDDNHIVSYVGFIPSTYNSGENERSRGVTKRSNGHLRYVLIEAAWVASKKDPELSLAYATLTKRMKPCDAIIRIAKKLVIRIKRVWEKMEPYQINKNIGEIKLTG